MGLWLLAPEVLGVGVGVGVVVIDLEFTGPFGVSWLPRFITVTVKEGRLCVDAEGLELQWEALTALPA